MATSYKLLGEGNYIDSSAVAHNRIPLDEFLGRNQISSNEVRIWDLDSGIYELTGDTPVLLYNGATGTETETRVVKGSIITVYYQKAEGFDHCEPTKSWYTWFTGPAGQGAQWILYGCTSALAGTVSMVNLEHAAKSPEQTVNEFGMFYWDGNAADSSDVFAQRLWQKVIDTALTKDVFVFAISKDKGVPVIFRITGSMIRNNTTGIYVSSTIDHLFASRSSTSGVGISYGMCGLTVHYENNIFTNVEAMSSPVSAMHTDNRFLPTTGTLITDYTPTNDYHPATKKYVDEALLYTGTSITLYGLNQGFYKFQNETTVNWGGGSFIVPAESLLMVTPQASGTLNGQTMYGFNYWYLYVNNLIYHGQAGGSTGSWYSILDSEKIIQNTAESLLTIGADQTIYSNYFTYATPGTYGFNYDNSTGYFENNNKGQQSTTAETNITLTNSVENGDLVIYYEVGSESNYDKFTLTIGGTVVVNAISGIQKGSYICPALTSGTIINLKYYKDNSNDNNGDYARVKLQKTSQIANNAVAPGNFVTKAQLDSTIGNINHALAQLTDL